MIRAGWKHPPGAADDRANRPNEGLAPPISCGRRLTAGLAAAGASVRAALADNAKNLPPNVPDWTRQLGAGVGDNALRRAVEIRKGRHPPHRALAHRDAGVVGRLHAAARTRRHHHAERPVLRAPPWRHRRGRSARLPADAAWPRRQAADLHARGHQAAAARQQHLFPRMRGQFRHGMARRAAQRLPIHPRHGALRAVHRRAAQAFVGAGGREAERQMDSGRGRRRRGDGPLDPARQGARRLSRRLSHERRDAAAGAGLSGAPGGAGLAGQCLGEMAAPPQGRRSALVHARGDVEIHRPVARRPRAQVHLS